MGVVQVGPWVPTPLPWAWNSPTCGVLALTQVDLPALAYSARLVPRHPSTSLGRCNKLAAAVDFVCTHVHGYVGSLTCQTMW